MDYKSAILNWLFLFAILAVFFFISRSFGLLAFKFGKTRWLYSVIGISTYFVGMRIGLSIIHFLQKNYSSTIPDYYGLPFCLLTPGTIYLMLRHYWTNEIKEQ